MTMLLVAHTLELFSRFQCYYRCIVNSYVFCYQKPLFRIEDYKFELKPMLCQEIIYRKVTVCFDGSFIIPQLEDEENYTTA